MPAKLELSPAQVRVLGCLIEKQRTTPDAYPLSLNALRLACNQSTNRDPVVDYDEATIRDALHRLERRALVRLASGAGSRAMKYRHLLAEQLPMNDAEQAVMCVLMLRGAQTPGELKQRGERIHAFADLQEVGDTLARLQGRQLVMRLGRRPGQKEERYGHLLAAEEEQAPAAAGRASTTAAPHLDGAATVGAPRLDGAATEAPRGLDDVSGMVGQPLGSAAPGLEGPRSTDPAHNGFDVAALEQRLIELEREVYRLREQLEAVL